MVTIRQCMGADIYHKKLCKQYAHTYHIEGNVVCVTALWKTLPIEYMMGLVAHEIGRLLAGNVENYEKEADRLANMFFGIRIRYRDSAYGKRLQYLSDDDTNIVYGWVLDNVTFNYPLHM